MWKVWKSLVCRNTCICEGHREDLVSPEKSSTVKGIISIPIIFCFLLAYHGVSVDTWSYFCLLLLFDSRWKEFLSCRLFCFSLTRNMPVPNLPTDILVLWAGRASVLLLLLLKRNAMMHICVKFWQLILLVLKIVICLYTYIYSFSSLSLTSVLSLFGGYVYKWLCVLYLSRYIISTYA